MCCNVRLLIIPTMNFASNCRMCSWRECVLCCSCVCSNLLGCDQPHSGQNKYLVCSLQKWQFSSQKNLVISCLECRALQFKEDKSASWGGNHPQPLLCVADSYAFSQKNQWNVNFSRCGWIFIFRCAGISWIDDVMTSLTENLRFTDRNQIHTFFKIFNSSNVYSQYSQDSQYSQYI